MSAKITELDACDLIDRLVINPNGAEFIVTKLTFEAQSGSVIIWIDELDLDKDEITPRGMEAGLPDLSGWSIHQKLKREKS